MKTPKINGKPIFMIDWVKEEQKQCRYIVKRSKSGDYYWSINLTDEELENEKKK